jgi:hemerythrin superfamily protein
MTSSAEDRTKAATRPDDVIRAVLLDHAEIKERFAETLSATGQAKAAAFCQLVHLLAVHETAEEEIVHPLARKAEGGDGIVEERLAEESESKALLAELEKLGPEAGEFDEKLSKLKEAVEAHAEKEEQEEHPHLEQTVDEERLQQLARVFRAAERTAPTHPHPHGPDSATGNLLVGPFAAIVDRTRDAIRKAFQAGS